MTSGRRIRWPARSKSAALREEVLGADPLPERPLREGSVQVDLLAAIGPEHRALTEPLVETGPRLRQAARPPEPSLQGRAGSSPVGSWHQHIHVREGAPRRIPIHRASQDGTFEHQERDPLRSEGLGDLEQPRLQTQAPRHGPPVRREQLVQLDVGQLQPSVLRRGDGETGEALPGDAEQRTVPLIARHGSWRFDRGAGQPIGGDRPRPADLIELSHRCRRPPGPNRGRSGLR